MNDEVGGARETVAFLSRSACRMAIAATLLENGETTRRDLVDETSVVRTTLQRNLDALRERGLIVEDGRRYELTAVGSHVCETLRDATNAAALAERVQPVLSRIPHDELPFDLERLGDATVVEATPANPYAPVQHHASAVETGDHLRLVLPATGVEPLEQALEALRRGARHDVVLAKSVLETLLEEEPFSDIFTRVIETDGATVRVRNGTIPYYLGVIDEAVQIGVHDESGLPAAILETEDETVRDWAVDRFEAYWSQSDSPSVQGLHE